MNVAKALPALRQSFSFDYGQQKREYHVLVDNQWKETNISLIIQSFKKFVEWVQFKKLLTVLRMVMVHGIITAHPFSLIPTNSAEQLVQW